MKAVQLFSEDYLDRVSRAGTGEILLFLESFRLLQQLSLPQREKELEPSAVKGREPYGKKPIR